MHFLITTTNKLYRHIKYSAKLLKITKPVAPADKNIYGWMRAASNANKRQMYSESQGYNIFMHTEVKGVEVAQRGHIAKG